MKLPRTGWQAIGFAIERRNVAVCKLTFFDIPLQPDPKTCAFGCAPQSWFALPPCLQELSYRTGDLKVFGRQHGIPETLLHRRTRIGRRAALGIAPAQIERKQSGERDRDVTFPQQPTGHTAVPQELKIFADFDREFVFGVQGASLQAPDCMHFR